MENDKKCICGCIKESMSNYIGLNKLDEKINRNTRDQALKLLEIEKGRNNGRKQFTKISLLNNQVGDLKERLRILERVLIERTLNNVPPQND